MNQILPFLIPAFGMIGIGMAAALFWRRHSSLRWGYLGIGAGLWVAAVGLKLVCGMVINDEVIRFLDSQQSIAVLWIGGGIFVGLESAVFEIGLTMVAVLIWRRLGRDAPRATGIGVGAGAIEAIILGGLLLVSVVICLAGWPGDAEIGEKLVKTAETTPLFWILSPVERMLALLTHAASRALVLLGVAHQRIKMVACGWILFSAVDGVAGAFLIAAQDERVLAWRIELAVLPFALISVAVLRWCWRRWPLERRSI